MCKSWVLIVVIVALLLQISFQNDIVASSATEQSHHKLKVRKQSHHKVKLAHVGQAMRYGNFILLLF